MKCIICNEIIDNCCTQNSHIVRIWHPLQYNPINFTIALSNFIHDTIKVESTDVFNFGLDYVSYYNKNYEKDYIQITNKTISYDESVNFIHRFKKLRAFL